MKKSGVLIVTEANNKVASGHLFECIVCYNELIKWIPDTFLMVNSDMPPQFKEKLPQGYCEYRSDIQMESDYLVQYILENQIGVIVFNLREISNDFIKRIRHALSVRIICIDEFGHRTLDADIIINPMIDESYWQYDSNAALYCGAEYLVLPPKIVKYHDMDKRINEVIRTVTVSMGGVDAPGSTLKIAKWLLNIWENVQLNIVIGGGFSYREELNEIIKNKEHVAVYQNIDFIYDLFFESDLAICAGGNTLHELAIIGVPTMVIPSMPHELKNGQAFQNKGFSFCCDLADEIKKEDFINRLKMLESAEQRRLMCLCGKKAADGKGYERVCSIVRNSMQE